MTLCSHVLKKFTRTHTRTRTPTCADLHPLRTHTHTHTPQGPFHVNNAIILNEAFTQIERPQPISRQAGNVNSEDDASERKEARTFLRLIRAFFIYYVLQSAQIIVTKPFFGSLHYR